MRNKLIAATSVLTLGTISLLAQTTAQSFSGTISDSMCGAHHMMKNETPAQCTRECIKQGSDFVLVSNGKVYTLKGDKAQFDKFAGASVTIKGNLAGNTISVSQVAQAK